MRYRVCGVGFDLMYTYKGTEGQFVEIFGEITSEMTHLSHMYDYMNTQQVQIVYNIIVTIYWEVWVGDFKSIFIAGAFPKNPRNEYWFPGMPSIGSPVNSAVYYTTVISIPPVVPGDRAFYLSGDPIGKVHPGVDDWVHFWILDVWPGPPGFDITGMGDHSPESCPDVSWIVRGYAGQDVPIYLSDFSGYWYGPPPDECTHLDEGQCSPTPLRIILIPPEEP